MSHGSKPSIASHRLPCRRYLNRRALFGWMVAWFLTTGLTAGVGWGDERRLDYALSFPAAAQHYVDVRLEFTTADAAVEVMMPVWTPGSYLIREYPRFVQDLKATDAEGKSLPLVKTRKNRWQIDTQGSTRVSLQYRVYGHELSVRTNWVDGDMAILNGAATFLVPVDRLADPCRIGVNLPPTWPRSVCPLPTDPTAPHTFLATHFDQLVDSPILCGPCQIFPFQVAGINHYLVNLGDDSLWDGQKAAQDLAQVVAAQQAFWGDVPYPEYYFLNVILGGGGGLEHDNSTLLMAGRRTMIAPQSYRRWLSLCSHEFFHAWNVRRLRPQALQTYDYENEVYTRELWVAEGLTSYYQSLLLVRAGLWTPEQWLQNLSSEIRAVETRPGNLVQSLSESSFDTWIDFYRPHENSANTSVSYYGRGAVAGLLLDAEIRRLSGGAASLDDAMVKLYQQHRETGYNNDDLLKICNELTNSDLSEWFDRFIHKANAFEYDAALALWGLELATAARGETANESRPEPVTLGITLRDVDGKTTVSAIRTGSAGETAGLNLDDEVLAINGRRINASSFSEELRGLKPGETARLLIARRGQLREIDAVVAANPTEAWRVVRLRQPTPEQAAQWSNWLGLPPADPNAPNDANDSKDASKSTETEASKENIESAAVGG